MNDLLFGIVLLSPLAVLASGLFRQSKWSLALAALPPLVASLLIPVGETRTISWLLLGCRLGTDTVTHWLLPAAALVWAAAGLHHALSDVQNARSSRFRLFFLLAMSGNLLLLLAQDAATFYVGYGMMGLAGYGVILNRRSTNARVAAGIYLRWTIAGELLLFSGLLSLTQDIGFAVLPLNGNEALSFWTLVLLMSGLGIKIGLPGLHAWMPGAYSASSTAGSAIFSGAMANAGILGLIQFLPLQQEGYTTAGMLLLTYGLVGAFYGVLLGLPQRRPKVILAYSSISQLGTLAAMIGLALMTPALAPALIIAVTAYAVHHGLTKAALFLAVDNVGHPRWRGLSITVLIALSLMMAGLPYSSGAVAKGMLKEAIGDGHSWLLTLLAIAGIATTLLMTRFLFACLAPSRKASSAPLWVGASLALLLLALANIALYQVAPPPVLSIQAIWPLAIAMILAFVYALMPSRAHKAMQPVIPKGDLPNLLAKALLRLTGRLPSIPIPATLSDRLDAIPLFSTRSSAFARIEHETPGDGRKSQ
jgi:formate hydrogenlyase subunit 3/multisubunit Na+/H+ antiporter MnhD subunit